MNIAIIGLGNIAHRVAQGIIYAKEATLYAVASRDINKVKAFSKQYNVEVYYDQYEDLLNDDKVEVVYICTPNHLHYTHIMECLKHHKHVICEKPLVASTQEVKQVFNYARQQNCFLMEAEKTVFTPLNIILKQKIEEGVIGSLINIKAEYNYEINAENLPKEHWVFDDVCGGCSYDVGVYPIVFANYYANASIKELNAQAIMYQDYICDFGMNVNVQYQNKVSAQISSSWLHTCDQKGYGYLIGEEGYIEIPAYWKGNQATIYKGEQKEYIQVEMQSDFTGQIEHAITCIKKGLVESPVMGEIESLQIMKVLEQVNLYRKEK